MDQDEAPVQVHSTVLKRNDSNAFQTPLTPPVQNNSNVTHTQMVIGSGCGKSSRGQSQMMQRSPTNAKHSEAFQ
jgi:hypothetical protein